MCALGVRAGAAQVRAVARKVRAPGPRRCVASRAAPAPTPAGRWPPVLVPAAPKTKCSQRMPQPPPAEAARRPWCHTATGRAAAGAAASAAPQTTRPRPPPPAALPQMLLRGRFAAGLRGREDCSAALSLPLCTLPASAPQTVSRRPPLHRRRPQVPVTAGRGGVVLRLRRRAPQRCPGVGGAPDDASSAAPHRRLVRACVPRAGARRVSRRAPSESGRARSPFARALI